MTTSRKAESMKLRGVKKIFFFTGERQDGRGGSLASLDSVEVGVLYSDVEMYLGNGKEVRQKWLLWRGILLSFGMKIEEKDLSSLGGSSIFISPSGGG